MLMSFAQQASVLPASSLRCYLQGLTSRLKVRCCEVESSRTKVMDDVDVGGARSRLSAVLRPAGDDGSKLLSR